MSNLLSFKAGVLTLNGTTVTSDKRKGLLVLSRTEDILFRLTWKERTAAVPEIDLLLVPGDATWKRVNKCTTGRVYLLEFVGSDQRFFFWMQEPSEDKDSEYETKINSFINPGSTTSAGSSTSQTTTSTAQPKQETAAPAVPTPTPTSAPTPVTPASAPATSAPATPATPTPASVPTQNLGGLQLGHLQDILSNMGLPIGAEQGQEEDLDLNDVLNTEVLVTLLQNNPTLLKDLIPHLPDDRKYETAEDIRSILRSPQFRQSVHGFSQALQTDQLAMLLSHLNLDPSFVASSSSGVDAFLKAIQNRYGDNSTGNKS